jgi:hypothetical protein
MALGERHELGCSAGYGKKTGVSEEYIASIFRTETYIDTRNLKKSGGIFGGFLLDPEHRGSKFLRNTDAHLYGVTRQKSPPLVLIRSQLNPITLSRPASFNVNIPSPAGSSK